MEVDIMVAFDKQDCPSQLYSSRSCLQEPFANMTDDTLNSVAGYVNNTDSFRELVHTNIDLLSEDNRTKKPSSYRLTHSTPRTTHIIVGSDLWAEYELQFDHTNLVGPRETTYEGSSGSYTLLT